MSFPVIASTTNTNGTTATTTPVVNLPTGSSAPKSGQLLVCVIRSNNNTAISGWPSDWTEIAESTADGSDDVAAIAWHLATGSEPSSITLSTTNSSKFAAYVLQIDGAMDPNVQPPELSTVATGASTTPDPTSVTPTGGAKDYLWVWIGTWEGEQTSPPTGNPANYAVTSGANSGTAGNIDTNCRVAKARRITNAASEDPGSWTISASDDWMVWTMAVHPNNADDTAAISRRPTVRSQAVNRSAVI